jgi:DNA-binding GntR family transcriptional regulator
MTDPRRRLVVKASDVVVDYILELLFTGQLRVGDRVDLDALASTLELSRVPIREALAQLERDGIVTTRHHRGAYVSAFDVREAVELYALLNGLTVTRVAEQRDKDVIRALEQLQGKIEAAGDLAEFEALEREFRRVINLAGSGPHLRALIRTFRGLLPAISRVGMARAMQKEKEYIAQEVAAIRRGSATAAARIAVEHIRYSGQCGIDELVRTGVLSAADLTAAPASTAHLLRIIKSFEA